MSQELEFKVRFSPAEGDLEKIAQLLNQLEGRKLDTAKKQKQAQQDRDTEIQLDRLSEAYMRLQGDIAKLINQQDTYKAQLRALNATKKKNGSLNEEEAQQYVAIQTALKDVNADMNSKRREMIGVQEASEVLGNSYDDIRRKMRALSIEIRNTQDPMGENKEVVDKLTKQYNEYNNTLKTIDASMGNYQRNVGDYTNSIRAAANAVAVFQGPLGPIAGRINSFATVLDRANVATNTLGVGLTRTAFIMRTALAVSGIGLLVVALGGLINFFRRTERGQQQLRIAMAAFSAVIDTIRERSIAFGETLWNTIKTLENPLKNFRQFFADVLADPFEAGRRAYNSWATGLSDRLSAVKDMFVSLGNVIRGAVTLDRELVESAARDFGNAWLRSTGLSGAAVERIQAKLDSISISGIAGSFRDLIDEISENVNQAVELEGAMNEVLVTERELNRERARMNAELARARERSRDFNETFEDRLEALDKVGEKERELFNRELANEQRRLEIMQEQDDMFESREEQLQAVADQEIRVNQMIEANAKREMSLLRDRNSVIRQMIEVSQRMRRTEFETQQIEQETLLQRTVNAYEMAGDQIRAIEARNAAIGLDEKDRIAQMTQDLIDANVDDTEAARLAEARVEAEIARERLDGERQLLEARRQLQDFYLDTATDSFRDASELLFGENKAVQVANTIIETARGIQRAFADLPFPASGALAAKIALSGANTIRKILSTRIGSTSAPEEPAVQVSEGFRFVDTRENENRLLTDVGAFTPQGGDVVINLTTLDDGELAKKVQDGNRQLAGRGISIRR